MQSPHTSFRDQVVEILLAAITVVLVILCLYCIGMTAYQAMWWLLESMLGSC